MNKEKLFAVVKSDYGRYISYCTYRFYEKMRHILDIIYDSDDIEQLIYLQLWTYIGRYDKNKSSFKTYIVMNMKTIFSRCIYLSMMEKRQVFKKRSLDQELYNDNGDVMNLCDIIADKSFEKMDNKINHSFNMMILKATYQRVYELSLEGYTQTEIAKLIHLSKERVRQIINKAGEIIRKRDWCEACKVS